MPFQTLIDLSNVVFIEMSFPSLDSLFQELSQRAVDSKEVIIEYTLSADKVRQEVTHLNTPFITWSEINNMWCHGSLELNEQNMGYSARMLHSLDTGHFVLHMHGVEDSMANIIYLDFTPFSDGFQVEQHAAEATKSLDSNVSRKNAFVEQIDYLKLLKTIGGVNQPQPRTPLYLFLSDLTGKKWSDPIELYKLYE